MTDKKSSVPLPPKRDTEHGEPRRVGVELEMKGLEIATLSGLVARQVGGDVNVVSDYEHHIEGDAAGAWRVELDFAYLKNRGRQERDDDSGILAQLDDAAEELLAAGSQAIMPMEVVSPPLPMARLDELEELIAQLRDAGAQGTRDGLTNAFGMHLNPELPGTDAATVTRYLKAFLCLYEWLKAEERVDLIRRVTPFIDPFPVDYVRKVVHPAYQPDTAALIDDYLADNPTRNRALDMLPLFADLDESRVRAVIDDARIKPRPTLHYRLPNCEIDEPGWGVGRTWRDWLQVEHLAGDDARLAEVGERYLEFLDKPVGRLVESWAEQVKPWLKRADDL